MKVGIITFHRAWNYGAVLQCYALQETIKNLGHDVQVIDYRQPAIEKCYQTFSLKGSIKALLKPGKYNEQGFLYRNRIRKEFTDFRDRFFDLTAPCTQSSIPDDFDVYIIGSDQLWVPNLTGGYFDDVYLGNFERAKHSRVLGYAISTNANSVSAMSPKEIDEINRNFSALSLRESSIADLLKKRVNCDIHVDLDPTLLLNKSSWLPVVNGAQKKIENVYMITYHLPGRYNALDKQEFMRRASIIANRQNLKIIDLSTFRYSVSDFVSLISNASLVLTSSFHATVFSLIFNRPLMSIALKDGHDSRYTELMKSLGGECMIYGKEFDKESYREADYNIINQNLTLMRQPSIKYLQDSIQHK